jgi:transcription-repair coupling factor (superfamily II helicase)
MHRTIARHDLAGHTQVLRQGQHLDLSTLLQQLLAMGYQVATLVEEPGAFSRRGGIVDVWPPTSENPLRLEFFGDEVESLRLFDPATQRSLRRLEAVTITPPSEVLLSHAPAAAQALAALDSSTLSEAVRAQWALDVERLAASEPFSGLEFYAPYFLPDSQTTTILDHFTGLVVLNEPQDLAAMAEIVAEQAEDFKRQLSERGDLPAGFARPYLTWEELAPRLLRSPAPLLLCSPAPLLPHALPALPFTVAPLYAGRLKPALDDMQQMIAAGQSVVVVTQQAKRLSALLGERDVIAVPVEKIAAPPAPGSLTLVQGSLAEGWTLREPGGRGAEEQGSSRAFTPAPLHPCTLALLTDVELFGWAKPRRATPRRRAARDAFLSDLLVGDYVVHIEHGIGVYRGLAKLTLDGVEREYLHLDYAEGDKLYVPTDQIDRVSRYIGVGEAAPTLTRLSGMDWERAKARAKKAVQQIARDLLDLYAARELAPGYTFPPDTPWQSELEASFPYIETPDQLAAIEAVKVDMERRQPMDRLICGDVGYGKTEVALRAAFKAAIDGKQVAILVPTTILAQQHYNTFQERLAAYPLRVEMLSRFRSDKEQREVVSGLQRGLVDIVIGTHRLLQKDVAFKDLGLVVIDEEQRFGVVHKERLKHLRQEVDVLTLTATPIPRTLHMSLMGVRDMSTIDTPPEERLPIVTYIHEYDETLIREAIRRELDRGGQVYFVHNRVQTIELMAQRVQRLVPEASLAVGHGQMPEEQLERVMLDFVQGRTDVLVCSAIIESGLDIPNVNTMIINKADRFGLAQLYQLRGRIGRGANRAYAYLLHDKDYQLTDTAQKRLHAIFQAAELGAGFRIAMKDLEIRGAGNLLGVEQHGHIAAVGFDLYTRLLAEAIRSLKSQVRSKDEGLKTKDEGPKTLDHPTLDLPLDAYLPGDYVADEAARLALYQRMAAVTMPEEAEEIAQELSDRFGQPPKAAEALLYILRLKAQAIAAGVESIKVTTDEATVKVSDPGKINQAALARRFGAALRVGVRRLHLDRRKLGGRWREELLALVQALGETVPITSKPESK